ncbi:NADPH-dependent FMN reductase [Flavobacterium taihuense]|uniref:NAD(P)H-dependent oxidoreductase n=1 Tax=Flavobacterium taihuense TaxID=2857508 RepID=A0ABS6Y030_9FLAO|nr:NAD(P)H-dependent oxidoreductase [Flavobacterium taihuense]MBW4362275.1 NAD(P)H-dependent oxidoreductase [Flavobacterium taihuense]
MYHITIISSSIRTGRKSHNVALYLQNYIVENKLGTVELLDLKSYNFPLFEERLQFQEKPKIATLEFAEKIKSSDGIIMVTPEYNGGFPASLKNVIDLLYAEWEHKPIGISTVSAGEYAGSQALIFLQFLLWKIKAFTIPATFPIAKVQEEFDNLGNALHKSQTDEMASVFIKELLWTVKLTKKEYYQSDVIRF